MIKGLTGAIVDIVFPRRCPVCGEIISPKGRKICKGCEGKLQVIREPRCKKCSKPIEQEEAEFCFDCTVKQFHYVSGVALWIYDKHMKKSVGDFKYRGRREYVSFYAEELTSRYGDLLKNLRPDALIPIPLHKTKLLMRGYNQTELIAKAVGGILQIPVVNDLLYRNKKTLPQKELNDKERLKNLSDAFEVLDQEVISYNNIKNVVLVDDIYTTGSTIEACTNVLLQAGVEKVFFLACV